MLLLSSSRDIYICKKAVIIRFLQHYHNIIFFFSSLFSLFCHRLFLLNSFLGFCLLCLYIYIFCVSKWRNEIKQQKNISKKNKKIDVCALWNDDVGKMNFWCVTKTNDAFLKREDERKGKKNHQAFHCLNLYVAYCIRDIFFFLFFPVLGWKTAVASILRYIFRLNSLNRFHSKTISPSSVPTPSSKKALFYSYKYYLFWWALFRRWFVLL